MIMMKSHQENMKFMIKVITKYRVIMMQLTHDKNIMKQLKH
jgi:hypothetical protein